MSGKGAGWEAFQICSSRALNSFCRANPSLGGTPGSTSARTQRLNKSSKSSGPVFTHAGDSGPNKPQGCRRRFAGSNLNVSQRLPFPVPFQSFGEFLDGEIVQDLWPKLIGSPHTTSFFAGSTGEYNQGSIYCVMIFDTNTGKLVSIRVMRLSIPQRKDKLPALALTLRDL